MEVELILCVIYVIIYVIVLVGCRIYIHYQFEKWSREAKDKSADEFAKAQDEAYYKAIIDALNRNENYKKKQIKKSLQ